MIFFVENEVDANFPFDFETVAKEVAEEALRCENCPFEAEVNLLITDDEGIHEMNRMYRQVDRETDVLSFPNISYERAGDFSVVNDSTMSDYLDPDTEHILLGDIVINEARVFSQAEEYGHSPLREFAFLVAHSMLHLMGYDHMEPEEAKDMEERQERVLQNLGITRETR